MSENYFELLSSINEKLWKLDERIDRLEIKLLGDKRGDEEKDLDPRTIEESLNPIEWIEDLVKSPLIRNFAVNATILGSAWELAESIYGKIPVSLQIITLTLIIGGSVWTIVKIIDKVVKGK